MAMTSTILGRDGRETDELDESMRRISATVYDAKTNVCHAMDLHTAAALGDYDCVRTLLKHEDPNRLNVGGWTPLIYAAYVGHDTILNLLLDDPRVDANQCCANGGSPLLWASAAGNESVAYFLLKHQVVVDKADRLGRTPLLEAASKGNHAVVKLLLAHGANIRQRDPTTEDTALLEAAANGHEIVVQQLIDHGADIHAHNKRNDTARSLAARVPNMAIVNLIDKAQQSSSQDLRSEPGLMSIPTVSPLSSPEGGTASSPSLQTTPDIRAGPSALMNRLQAPGRKTKGSLSPILLADTGNELEEFLMVLGLEKYLPLFRKEEVDFSTLVTMTEADLKAIGLKLFGPRRKIATAIKKWNQQRDEQALEVEQEREALALAEQLRESFDAQVSKQVETLSAQVAALSTSLSEAEMKRMQLAAQLDTERRLRETLEVQFVASVQQQPSQTQQLTSVRIASDKSGQHKHITAKGSPNEGEGGRESERERSRGCSIRSRPTLSPTDSLLPFLDCPSHVWGSCGWSKDWAQGFD
eukprot:m.368471 g.368471  ORF g.368471 m.368471 type:complete len:528 (+) comp19977_c1_seq19:57-1640(+)